MLSKSLIQFSVDGQGCVPSLLFNLGPNSGGGDEGNGTSSKRSHAGTATLSAPDPERASGDPRLRRRCLDTHGQVWVSLSWGHRSFLLGPGAPGSVCALPESVSRVLCKFWRLYGGVKGDLLQEGLCHTQVCCTQSPSLRQATADPTLLWITTNCGKFLKRWEYQTT